MITISFYFFLAFFGTGLIITLFRFLGYSEGNIRIKLPKHYESKKSFLKAVQRKLEQQNHFVVYQGENIFFIDGKRYIMYERQKLFRRESIHMVVLIPEEHHMEHKNNPFFKS